ncbi:MAG: AraC family transcriptional regulator [Ruminococcaceae bacterium]|nr:AraC family transcriptional regulator [Oscillospiraceae bacterium]
MHDVEKVMCGKDDGVKFESELNLLQDTFKKLRIKTRVVYPSESLDKALDFSIRDIISKEYDTDATVQSFVAKISPKTMYRYTDEFKLCYIYFKLSSDSDNSLLFLGPYLSNPLSKGELLELAENIGVPPRAQRYFEEFYSAIPTLSEGNPAFVLLDTFCERIWGSVSFAIVDLNKGESPQLPIITPSIATNNFDEATLNVKTMETRYNFENELIQAVSLGQLHKEKLLSVSFSENFFEKRASDPLRNAKNYAIIMNTLLRKAAEQGGVHPIHIDKVSSEYAKRIEEMPSLVGVAPLMKEMFRNYCRLVRKHSIQNYSIIVQKVITLIEDNLSSDFTLTSLALSQNVSPSYLSSLFKRETGKTISEFIREKRIDYAARLLKTTQLQVQTVALHCGIVDVQYFSKLFKKQMGKTPKEYREAQRNK